MSLFALSFFNLSVQSFIQLSLYECFIIFRSYIWCKLSQQQKFQKSFINPTMSNLRKISYAECDKQNHQFQPLSRICVDENCPNRTLVCCICQALQHKGHQTTPLKTFLHKIDNLNHQFNTLNIFYYSNRVQQFKYSFFNSIATQKGRILNIFNDLEVQAEIYFDKIENMAATLISMGNIANVMNKSSSNSKAIKSYFSQLIKFFDVESKQQFSLKKQLDILVDSCKDKEKKMEASFEAIKIQVQKNILKVKSTLQDHSAFKAPSFQWSQELKGHKVKITGTLVEQTNMQSSGQRFALIEPGLSEFGKRKQGWGIKVKKFVGWIGLGICLKNAIKKANYHFNYTNIGHGSYLISSNGYSWSHSVKQFNSAFKTFTFTINDIVYMQYDPEQWKLRFRKNNGPQSFQLSITPPPSDDCYHPCVNLCSTGDSVELILPGLPLS